MNELNLLLARINKAKAEQESGVYGEAKGNKEKWKLEGWYSGLDYVISEIECMKRDQWERERERERERAELVNKSYPQA